MEKVLSLRRGYMNADDHNRDDYAAETMGTQLTCDAHDDKRAGVGFGTKREPHRMKCC
eukprot:NODE_11957_length_270_cov_1.530233.p3 GENE.NODE_11957_length_270_cov_1.530233~~NODE_11957_length_270_cov_1.530233.p3  ORF type:complete len:58 (-),score=3.83 NODE_11957_length_270_cov_1.530233:67-240(-)